MKKSSALRRGRTCVFSIHAHLVFVTKYRRKVFTKRSLKDLKTILSDICNKMQIELIEFDGENDHVHILIHYLPKLSLSKIIKALKGASSRRIRKLGHQKIQNALWGKNLWSPSYFVSSCGGAHCL